jgi:MFS transporter, putative metabolite:H+ symporter
MKQKKNIALLITVASLGYFVDIYDLILFNIIKKDSLSSLNIDVNTYETVLFRWQMAGMLIGGLIWGILGDVKGRVSVLFGSILLYSVANVANAFVTTVEAYKFWRLLAGIGLAGELGAAITLVSELMPKEKRGIGTMIIVTFGALGAVFAFFVAKNGEGITTIVSQIMGRELENWQTAYIVGGVLGLLLLLMRAGTFESALFENATTTNVKRGNFFMLFRKAHFRKYLACIVIGLPVWFVVGILIALSHKFFPEILASSGVKVDAESVKAFSVATPEMVMWSYVGLSPGDLLSGLLSQLFKSRKKVIYLNLMGIAAMTLVYLYGPTGDQNYYRFIAFSLGAVTGYWAIFVTNASEQFGTNIRSTVAATVPNFVRGGVLLITMGFEYFSHQFQVSQSFDGRYFSVAALIIGAICLVLAFWGTYNVEEAFHKDLDYFEDDVHPTEAKNNA